MRVSVSMAGEGFARLRRRVAEIEGRGAFAGSQGLPPAPGDPHPSSSFQEEGFDTAPAKNQPSRQNLTDRQGSATAPPPLKGEGRGRVLAPRRSSNATQGEVDSILRKTGPISASLIQTGADSIRIGSESPPSLAPRRGSAILSLGLSHLDARLAGGLRRDALHEIRAGSTGDSAAATGFAAAILARLAAVDDRPILVILEAAARREAGFLYGPGLDRFGLDSKRLVVATPRRPGEALWVFEEGLRCRGLAAVLTELRGHPRRFDLTASRRLALRARDSGVMGLLLRQASPAEPGAATTRWSVTPRRAADIDAFAAGIGRPVWRLALERNRFGTTGTFDLEWDHECLAFAEPVPAPALSRSHPALSADRSGPPPDEGQVVAYRRAS